MSYLYKDINIWSNDILPTCEAENLRERLIAGDAHDRQDKVLEFLQYYPEHPVYPYLASLKWVTQRIHRSHGKKIFLWNVLRAEIKFWEK